jgi:hypothetical protein
MLVTVPPPPLLLLEPPLEEVELELPLSPHPAKRARTAAQGLRVRSRMGRSSSNLDTNCDPLDFSLKALGAPFDGP